MQITLLKGYPDKVGKRCIFVGTGTGPVSYTGGNAPTDAVTGLPFQFYIDIINEACISVSGTYYAVAQPSTTPIASGTQAALPDPRATWFLRYFTTATGAEVTNATNLSAEKFTISGYGGFF